MKVIQMRDYGTQHSTTGVQVKSKARHGHYDVSVFSRVGVRT